jgi:hypothetical protein
MLIDSSKRRANTERGSAKLFWRKKEWKRSTHVYK